MNEIPLSALFIALGVLVLLSGFFSGSETALMTINRYRLRHLAKHQHRGAVFAQRLLKRPDRLIGLILLGNNFVNILASSLATVIALRLYGEAGIAIAAGLLTLVILVFSEVAPKTLAALHPERLAFVAAFVYTPLLKVLYPAVWVVNAIANNLLRHVLRVDVDSASGDSLSREELRTLVNEVDLLIPARHQAMLVNILDLEKVTVNDIMVPRNEIHGIDLDEAWDDIQEQIANSAHSRVPVYRENIDNTIGLLYLRRLVTSQSRDGLSRELLESLVQEAYFIPENTPLTRQLLAFQRHRRHIGLVVDEYGDIQGLVTLEDILEEIVGEFTENTWVSDDIRAMDDGSFVVAGSTHIREINRALSLRLSTDGPKTLNGLVLEHLESIPEPGTTFLLENHPVEIIKTRASGVVSVRIHPPIRPRARASVAAIRTEPPPVAGD